MISTENFLIVLKKSISEFYHKCLKKSNIKKNMFEQVS